jgi:hypothetical protein
MDPTASACGLRDQSRHQGPAQRASWMMRPSARCLHIGPSSTPCRRRRRPRHRTASVGSANTVSERHDTLRACPHPALCVPSPSIPPRSRPHRHSLSQVATQGIAHHYSTPWSGLGRGGFVIKRRSHEEKISSSVHEAIHACSYSTLPTPAKPFLVSLFAVVLASGDEIVRAQPVADRCVQKIFT